MAVSGALKVCQTFHFQYTATLTILHRDSSNPAPLYAESTTWQYLDVHKYTRNAKPNFPRDLANSH
jgi:hypothetical protein